MELDDRDIEILNATGCQEPWHVIAASLCDGYGDPRELVERLFRLQEKGLLTLAAEPEAPEPSMEAFVKAAEKDSWYAKSLYPSAPGWMIRVTESGFEELKRTGRSDWD